MNTTSNQEIQTAFATQVRVVDALFRRELIALYGRQGIGFLMVMIEPLVIMSFVFALVIYRQMHASAISFPLMPFVVSGYGIMWMCRYPIQRMGGAIKGNTNFLYHRQIKPFDLLTGRTVILMFGTVLGYAIILALTFLFTSTRIPDNILTCLISFVLVLWYVFSFCILIGSLASFAPFGNHLCMLAGVAHILSTGGLFMVDWLPQRLRGIALLFPMVHATEMMRDGWFGDVVICYYSTPYVIVFNLALTLFSLLLVRSYSWMRETYGSPT